LEAAEYWQAVALPGAFDPDIDRTWKRIATTPFDRDLETVNRATTVGKAHSLLPQGLFFVDHSISQE
jgi:hypothetical protein